MFNQLAEKIKKCNEISKDEFTFVKNEILVPLFGLGCLVCLFMDWYQHQIGVHDAIDSLMLKGFSFFLFIELLFTLFAKKILIKHMNYGAAFVCFAFAGRLLNGFYGDPYQRQAILVSMICFIPLVYVIIFMFVQKHSLKFAITFYIVTLVECVFIGDIFTLTHDNMITKQAVFGLVFMQPLFIFSCVYFAHIRKVAIKSTYNENMDMLTGIRNRRSIQKELDVVEQHMKQLKSAIILIDVDNFKNINDTYGHNVGDEVLKAIAVNIAGSIRLTDSVGRWGGEEFIVLIQETDIDAVYFIAEKIRKSIENMTDLKCGRVTISLGIALTGDETNIKNVIERADDGLYEAKKTGKNKVVSIQK